MTSPRLQRGPWLATISPWGCSITTKIQQTIICAVSILACDHAGGASTLRRIASGTRRSASQDAACAMAEHVTAMRSYSGGADCIVLTHPIAGGRFDFGGCTVDDGGVCIRLTNGRYFARPLGTPHVWHVDYFASGYTSDQMMLAAATYHSREDAGAIVIFDRVYEQTDTLSLYDNITYRGGGLRRACQVSTVLIGELSPVGVDLVVESTSGFHANQAVFISPSNGYEPSIWASYIDGEPSDSTHMRISAPLGYAASAGWSVSVVWPQIRQIEANGTQGPTPGMAIEGMEFDGHAACNTHVHDWRYQDVGAIKAAAVSGVYVHDTPSESFTVCGTTLTDSRFVDLGGSMAHKSCSSPAHDEIARVVTRRTNQLTDAVVGHSEGTITLSANSGDTMVSACDFSDSPEGVLGTANGDDSGITVRDSVLTRHARLCSRTPGATDVIVFADNQITDVPISATCP